MIRGGVRGAELRRLKTKLLTTLPQGAKDRLKKANDLSAKAFARQVRQIIPVDEKTQDGVHLVNTLTEGPGSTETATQVGIGGPGAPYPLHLESGHRAPDGSHVPAKPFWNPAKRLARKKHKGRASRAITDVAKMVAK